MRVAAVNKFVQGLATSTQFAQLTGQDPSTQETYDYSQHFFRAARAADDDLIPDLNVDVGFFSEGPCARLSDDSYCSYDPDMRDRLPSESPEILRARDVIEVYLAAGGPSLDNAEDAIKSEV